MHDRFPKDERYAPEMRSDSTASEIFVPEEELQPGYWMNRVAELRAWSSGQAAPEREPEEPLFGPQKMFGMGSADMTAVPQPLAGNSDAPQHPNVAPQPLEDIFAGNTAGAPIAPEPEQYIPAPGWDADIDWPGVQQALAPYMPEAFENMPADMGMVAEEQLPQEQDVARPFAGYALPDGYAPADMGTATKEVPAAQPAQRNAGRARKPAQARVEKQSTHTTRGRPKVNPAVAGNRQGQPKGWPQALKHHSRCAMDEKVKNGSARPACNADCVLRDEFPETSAKWKSQSFKVKKPNGVEDTVSGFFVYTNEKLGKEFRSKVLGEYRLDNTLDEDSTTVVIQETMSRRARLALEREAAGNAQ